MRTSQILTKLFDPYPVRPERPIARVRVHACWGRPRRAPLYRTRGSWPAPCARLGAAASPPRRTALGVPVARARARVPGLPVAGAGA